MELRELQTSLIMGWETAAIGGYKTVKVAASTCETQRPTLESPIAVEVTDATNQRRR